MQILFSLLTFAAVLARGQAAASEQLPSENSFLRGSSSSHKTGDRHLADDLPNCLFLNIRSSDGRYLSTTADGRLVDLYSEDDGSGRQRWILLPTYAGDGSYIFLVAGGISSVSGSLLSVNQQGSVFDLYYFDDASGRQRWILHPLEDKNSGEGGRPYAIQVANGVDFGLYYDDEFPAPPLFLTSPPFLSFSFTTNVELSEEREWSISCVVDLP